MDGEARSRDEFRITKWAPILLGIVTLALLLAAIVVATREGSRQQRVLVTLDRYQRAGLFNHELVTDKRESYRLSVAVLNYSGTKTFGQFKKELQNLSRDLARNQQSVELTMPFAKYATTIASHLAANTRFKGRVVVNQLPPEGYLGVLFLAADPEKVLPGFAEDTCAYLVGTTVIICNANSVRKTLAAMEAVAENMSTMIGVVDANGDLQVTSVGHVELVRQFLKQNFLIWLLGHEIGHAEIHRASTDGEALHFDLVYDQREREADDFVVSATHGDNAARAAFPGMLLEFIEQDFQARFTAEHGSPTHLVPAMNSPPESVVVAAPAHGVPLILRAMRIMDRTLADNADALEQAAYVVVDGRIAYVGSIKSADYYHFLKQKVVLPTEVARVRPNNATRIMLFSALAATVVLGAILRQSKRGS